VSKVACKICGVLVLWDTAARNDGKCVPCHIGTRDRIESAKKWYREEREREKTDPLRRLWRDLVHRAYETPNGFGSFSDAERQYFAVGLLEGAVYCGGFDQYFFNSSGDYYRYAVEGLEAMGAPQALDLLRRAKHVLFGFEEPEPDTECRRALLRATVDASRSKRLDSLDTLFYQDPDSLGAKVEQFAKDRGLVSVA
jgi:hypothetical protein